MLDMDYAGCSQLVAEVSRMSPEEMAAKIEEARTSSAAEIVERQKEERRVRAERAAARFASR